MKSESWDIAASFTKSIRETGTKLDQISRELAVIECPNIDRLTINLQDLSAAYNAAKIASCNFGANASGPSDYVYVIRIDDEAEDISEKLCAQMEKSKPVQKQAGRRVGWSRINAAHLPSRTLYVGRSKAKAFATRLEWHLGEKRVEPYGLHLELWATANDLDVTIDYMRFDNRDDSLVQAIEDGLWTLLRPAFGRQGAR